MFSLSFFSFSPQYWWRGVLERQRFTRLRSAVILLQRATRRKLETKHKGAAKIQALVRGFVARKHLIKLQQSALEIQVRNSVGKNVKKNSCDLFFAI